MSAVHVAYQGVGGSYSSLAARECFPDATATGYPTFRAAIEAVQSHEATHALLPIENSTAGRVADMHHLLPDSGLTVIAEHFLPIHHALIGTDTAALDTVTRVYSHREALAQCTQTLARMGLESVPFGDTAGAVAFVAEQGDPTCAALAATRAADIYPRTQVLKEHMEDDASNVTRFLILTHTAPPVPTDAAVLTSIVYDVRNVPMALYKSLSGFAEYGVNIVKLESFVPMTRNKQAQFYLEFEGAPEFEGCAAALSALSTYAHHVQVLGTYPKSAYRATFE